MKKRSNVKRITALLTAMIMALCLVPSGVVSGEEQVVCSPFDAPEGVITDYTIEASADAEIEFEPASGAAQAIIIHSGTVKLSNQGTSAERIIVDGNARLILAGVNVKPTDGPAVKAMPGTNVKVELAEGSTNTLTGAGKSANNQGWAGLEVGWAGSNSFSTVTILGKGTLKANGGFKSAGIGASYTNRNEAGTTISSYCGNIIIESGNITAVGDEGAGIGTANNNRKAEDGSSTFSASYKMTRTNATNEIPTWGTITINGGTVHASSNGGGAGIGGGNHVDGNKIIINGGKITAIGGGGGGAGIGCGIGSQKQESNLTKGPGYYNATIEIHGGDITAKGTWLGAGIGGGYACDAKISITGGTINATGGNGNSGANYQGAPGIGAGYMGIPQLAISGGSITAKGGTGAPGIGYGPGALEGNTSKDRGQDATYKYDQSYIEISGGTIDATGGINGAGIGGGNGNQYLHIRISGGDITARGYSDADNLKFGGAGIGSGTGLEGGATKYKSNTEVDIAISGSAKVLAIGGWGASGIGSGAANTMAKTISIGGSASVEAYADGTKFAIDSRVLDEDTGMTTSQPRDVSIPVLQGTFVHKYVTEEGVPQNPEGLNSITVINEQTGKDKELTKMPAGYRSFATTVVSAGTYTVYTDAASIGEGEGRYFKRTAKDVFNKDEVLENGIKYTVSGSSLCDNFYLFPVKTVVVEKQVLAEGDTDLSGLNETLHFGLYHWAEEGQGEQEGELQEIKVVNGVPQGKAYFVDVPDGKYEVLEVDASGKKMDQGTVFGIYVLKKIRTEDLGGGSSNNGEINQERWTEKIIVKNTFSDVTTKVTGTKTWNDHDDADKIRPGSITVKLYADGKAVEGETRTVSADTKWQYSFEGLKKYRTEGQPVEYTVKEDPVPNGYTVKYATPVVKDDEIIADIENSHEPEPTATPTPTPTPTPETTETPTPTPETTETPTPTPEPTETPTPEPTETPTPTPEPTETPTPTPVPDLISLTVIKNWDDGGDQDGLRPDSVTVELTANNKTIRTIILSRGNGWRATVPDLPAKDEEGKEITYTWTENPVRGYKSTVTTTGNTTTIVNRHTPEVVPIMVRKVWEDNNNALHTRPDHVTMRLSNGMIVVLNEQNGWSATLELPVYREGKEIKYTWTEHEVIGYVLKSVREDNGMTTFTNALWERPETPPAGRKPKTPGKEVTVFEEYETPLGLEVSVNHAGDCFD